MKIVKCGGPSFEDANALKAFASYLTQFSQEQIIVVVEAFGATRSLLEKAAAAAFNQDEDAGVPLETIVAFHFNMLHGLIENPEHPVFAELNNCFVELEWGLEDDAAKGFEFLYDQVISIGTVLASKITSAYLNEAGCKNNWLDIRDCIQTDNEYTKAQVDALLSKQYIQEIIPALFVNGTQVLVTQGGIGCTSENFTTTLGSDALAQTLKLLSEGLNATLQVSE
jgi:aspartate kinase